MKPFDKGNVCYKTHGRDAGDKVIVVEAPKEKFAVVEGLRRKKRKCNIMHLLSTGKRVELSANYTKEDIRKALV
jgi:ribosomal protein L14E/L6E/L27E